MANRKAPIATRVLSWFLLWTALRSAYALYLGQANSDYRFAWEAGFGPAVWAGEALYAFLATGAFAAIWTRSRISVPLVLAAMAVSTSLLLFQLQQVEVDPQRARAAYAESRRVRGLPVPESRLDQAEIAASASLPTELDPEGHYKERLIAVAEEAVRRGDEPRAAIVIGWARLNRRSLADQDAAIASGPFYSRYAIVAEPMSPASGRASVATILVRSARAGAVSALERLEQ